MNGIILLILLRIAQKEIIVNHMPISITIYLFVVNPYSPVLLNNAMKSNARSGTRRW